MRIFKKAFYGPTNPRIILTACLAILTSSLPAPIFATFSGPVGPQASITCPVGAFTISQGQDISAIVNSKPINTTFCVQAGTYFPNANS